MVRKQTISATGIRPLYADMVVRVHELCLVLIGQAQAGNEQGVLTSAEQLQAQTGALVDLLSRKHTRNRENND
ncbi:MAG: hypothetical protein IKJ29_06170 [Akkermansia sp.]|nr:hypothetical protein [Akkermansia sp.]